MHYIFKKQCKEGVEGMSIILIVTYILITILMVIDIMYCIFECFSVFTNDSDPLKGKIKSTIIVACITEEA